MRRGHPGPSEGRAWRATDPLLCPQGQSGAGSPGFQTWQSSTPIPVQEEGAPRAPGWRAWSPVAPLLGAQLLGQGAELAGSAKDCGHGNQTLEKQKK